MTNTQQGDRVTLEMTLAEFNQLTLILGYATGAAMEENKALAYSWLAFANAMNATNPSWRPYYIPETS